MRKFVLASVGAALLTAGTAQAETLKLKLEGVQPRGGSVLVAVQSRDQYMMPAMVTGSVLGGDTNGDVVLSLPLPSGEYAVTVLHDADSNHDMTMGADGKPAEGWATVNLEALRGPPLFDQVKFVVDGDTDVTLAMAYPAY